jgi:hypothetical protein
MKKEIDFEKGLRVIVRITKNYYNTGFLEDALSYQAFSVLLDNGELIVAASKNVRAIAKG